MTTWILGKGGWIAGKIKKTNPEYEYLPEKMIACESDLHEVLKDTMPGDIIINCVGYTGVPNVDGCETRKYTTFLANTNIPFWLAENCRDKKIVHLSTGCIYDGDKNFTEEDRPNYVGSFYSITKLVAEEAFDKEKDLIIRLRLPITEEKDDKNTLVKLLKYQKLINEKNSVTFIPDLIDAIKVLIDKQCVGVYNVVNPEPITHKEIMEIIAPEKDIEYISMDELRKMTVADRSNCTLSTEKLSKIYKMVPTKDAIRRFVK